MVGGYFSTVSIQILLDTKPVAMPCHIIVSNNRVLQEDAETLTASGNMHWKLFSDTCHVRASVDNWDGWPVSKFHAFCHQQIFH